MSRHRVVALQVACLLCVFLGRASAQSPPNPPGPRAAVLEGLVLTLEDYRKDSALLLESVLARDSSRIALFDAELTPSMQDLERYVDRTRERCGLARAQGLADDRTDRAAALVYAYAGIAYGRVRRFPQGHALLDSARALHPGVGQEPSPLSWAARTDTLGTLMEAVTERWYRKLGRVRVTASPQWTTDSLRFTPIQVEAVIDTSAAETPSDPLTKSMYDSVRALTEAVLRDSIRASSPAFDLYLPRGGYNVRDAQGLLVPVRVSVGDSANLAVDPRVDLWLPKTNAEADTIRLREVVGDTLGAEVDSGRIPIGKVLDMTIDVAGYERRQERVFFCRPGFPGLDQKGVVVVRAEPGKPCLYLKEGKGKLKKKFFVRRCLKYAIIPAVFLLLAK